MVQYLSTLVYSYQKLAEIIIRMWTINMFEVESKQYFCCSDIYLSLRAKQLGPARPVLLNLSELPIWTSNCIANWANRTVK